MKNPHFEEKKLDPVGQADADIDNDGDVGFLLISICMKRRKAIWQGNEERVIRQV